MTSKELDVDERIEIIYDHAEGYDGLNRSIKQLIRDCIEAVTPNPMRATGDLDSDYAQGYHHGNNDFVDTIQANTKELLG